MAYGYLWGYKNVGHSLLTSAYLQTGQPSIVACTNDLNFLYKHVINALDSLIVLIFYKSIPGIYITRSSPINPTLDL